MLTSEQIDKLISEYKLLSIAEKSQVLTEFFKEYGENAVWEEWLAFLYERPELKGFQWTRSLTGIFAS